MILKLFTYMARMSDNETIASLAVSHSNSLRTTIPIHIVRKLCLASGDHIVWDIDKIKGKWIAPIRKKELPQTNV